VELAVVGHVEWIEFVRVERVPAPGEIVHALETWEEAAGGGAVAAVQLVNLGASVRLFTALGSDELGKRAREQLEPQRRGFTYVDEVGERTITILGDKLVPRGEDSSLPWEELGRANGAYFVSGDARALEQARRARVLVATARELPTLRAGSVALDALVGSGEDDSERYRPGDLEPAPKLVVTTAGALGGWVQPGGPFTAASLPGRIEDAYGCGDCFAAGLTYALADGRSVDEAVELGARCGAAVLCGRGAYAGQLTDA
jgi:ribokinase